MSPGCCYLHCTGASSCDVCCDDDLLRKDMEATATEILHIEEELDQTPSPRRQSPRKTEQKDCKYMVPYTQPRASPIRVRYDDNKKSDIWPESKPFLMDEYHQVRNGHFPGKYVKDLAAYYCINILY